MIYVTGDLHGDFSRLNAANCPAKDGDYVIICGDFGGVWDNSRRERWWLKWLENKPFTTLFVCGNHENFDLLYSYPVEEWRGGKIHRINKKVIHLMRGQVFTIEGKTFFTMGGATSHDVDNLLNPDASEFKTERKKLKASNEFYRVIGKSWWPQELPNAAEYEEAITNLDNCNWRVDYIITHCAPEYIQGLIADTLGFDDIYKDDELTIFLQRIFSRCEFGRWFHGHYHTNVLMRRKVFALYENFIALRNREA